jgi:hypothetical protein
MLAVGFVGMTGVVPLCKAASSIGRSGRSGGDQEHGGDAAETAIVTGGAGGFGFAISRTFANEGAVDGGIITN